MTPTPQAHHYPARRYARAADWLAAAAKDWLGSEGERWIFVLKTLLAAFTALWLAYRLGLDSPSTAMTTTVILALPSSGMVLEKSFYRLCGTLVGCSSALALIGLFPQQPVLLFAGLALWVGLCTSGAALYRNAQSYAYVLSGYTACMIVLPSIEQPTLVFSLAVTRVAEVSLGIICSAVVSSVLLPRHQSAQVMHTVQARYSRFLGFCHDVLEQKLSPAQVELSHLQFAADVAALELGRSAALFEVSHALPDPRAQSHKLHAFNSSFMTALTTFYTLHRLFDRLQRDRETQVLALSAPLYAIVADALKATPTAAPSQASLDAMQIRLQTALAQARRQVDSGGIDRVQRIDFDTAGELLERFVRDMSRYHEVYHSLVHETPLAIGAPQAYAPKTPPALVLASGVRVALGLGLFALGAYYLNWPYASSAILMASIFCGLASSSPRPIMMIRQVLNGFLLAIPLAVACLYFVLVHADGFPMLVLSFAPFLAVGVFLTANPAKAGTGIGVSTFLTQMAPANVMHVDGAAFLNSGLSLVIGLILAALVFSLILPQHTMGHRDHIGPALWREALNACVAAPRRLKHRFNNRVRDLLSQLNAAAGPAPGAAARSVVRQALTLLEIGHSVIELRELIAASAPSAARASLQECVNRIADYLRVRSGASCKAALDATLQAGAAVRDAQLGAAPERALRLQTALTDLHSIYTSLLDQLPPATGASNHAA